MSTQGQVAGCEITGTLADAKSQGADASISVAMESDAEFLGSLAEIHIDGAAVKLRALRASGRFQG